MGNKLFDDNGYELDEWQEVSMERDQINRGIEDGRTGRGFGANLEAMVGLCAKCDNYNYVENDVHQIIHSVCNGFGWDSLIAVSGKNKIRNCSNYTRKGEMSLRDMYKMATLIDPDCMKDTPGFITPKKKENKNG
jgi:hypothetical protein